jgi:hypothetical protein
MRYEGEKYIMNSNPTTLSVDEQIEKLFDNAYILPYHPVPDTAGELRGNLKPLIKSLIKEICEEVTPNRCTATRGNTQNPNNPMYSTKYAKGWNDCIDEQRTKLNKILGEGK